MGSPIKTSMESLQYVSGSLKYDSPLAQSVNLNMRDFSVTVADTLLPDVSPKIIGYFQPQTSCFHYITLEDLE